MAGRLNTAMLARTLLVLTPLLTYPLWRGAIFYHPFALALAASAALAVVIFASSIQWPRLIPLSDARTAGLIAVLSYLLYSASALGLFGRMEAFSGDEPNYLLATHSMLSDRDIRLKDDFAARDYTAFYPGKLTPRMTQGRDKGGYPVHGIAVSAYLMPFYYVGSRMGGPADLAVAIRLGMALLASGLVAAIFLLLRRLEVDRGVALATAALLAATPPILNYSILVYPETTVALIIAIFFRQLLASPPRWVLCAALVALCPWFGVKFNAVAAAMALVLLARLLRSPAPTRLRALLSVLAAAAPLAAAYELFLWHFYGSFSPAAAAGGRAAAVKDSVAGNLLHYFSRDTLAKLSLMPQTFLADLFDQKGGVLLYCPVLAFALYGLLVLVRQSEARRKLAALVLPAAIHLGLYTYTNYLGGYCPPGRPLLPLLPLLAWPLAIGIESWRNRYTRSVLLGAAILLCIGAMEAPSYFLHDLIYSDLRQITNFSALLDGPDLRPTDYLPVLTVPGIIEWRNLVLVTGVLALLLLTAHLQTRRLISDLAAAGTILALVVWLAAVPKVFQRARLGPLELEFLDGAPAFVEERGIWLRGSSSGRFRLVADRPIRGISFEVRNGAALVLKDGDREYRPDSPGRLRLEVRSDGQPGGRLYSFRVTGGFRPSSSDPRSKDHRWLGVFIAADGVELEAPR